MMTETKRSGEQRQITANRGRAAGPPQPGDTRRDRRRGICHDPAGQRRAAAPPDTHQDAIRVSPTGEHVLKLETAPARLETLATDLHATGNSRRIPPTKA